MSLPIFRQRNQSIKAEFNLLLRSQMPTMLIYAKMCRKMCQNEKSPFKGDLEGLTFVSFFTFFT